MLWAGIRSIARKPIDFPNMEGLNEEIGNNNYLYSIPGLYAQPG